MAHTAGVSESIVATLVRKGELRSGDITNHDHQRVSHRMGGVVRHGSRNSKRLGCLGRGLLTSDAGDETQRNKKS